MFAALWKVKQGNVTATQQGYAVLPVIGLNMPTSTLPGNTYTKAADLLRGGQGMLLGTLRKAEQFI